MNGPRLVWQTFPLGLLAADQSGRDRTAHRTLDQLIEWLPHIASLGADTLLLGPVFSSLSHGYDTLTHRVIDDRLGTVDDLDRLIAAGRQHGIGIVLDGVFAYAARGFWRLDDPAERHSPWFRRHPDGQLVPWRGVDSLVTPDYDVADYQAYVADVMTAWLDRGIVGWRLDSSWSVPSSFWMTVLGQVRQAHPSAWFLGQVFDDELIPVLNAASYSSATEYALMNGVRDWLSGAAVDQMTATLQRHRGNSATTAVQTFVGNHDVARLADVIDADLLAAAFAVLLTVPGIPSIYYGDELAVRSAPAPSTAPGSDAALRPPLAPSDVASATGPAAELLDVVRRLGRFRAARPWLTGADLRGVESRGGSLRYRCVGGHGDAIEVFVNPTPVTVRFDDAAGDIVLGSGETGPTSVAVAPRSWAVLQDSSGGPG